MVKGKGEYRDDDDNNKCGHNNNRTERVYHRNTNDTTTHKRNMKSSRPSPSASGSTPASSGLKWLAQSMGYVDTLCCYSYSAEQIASEDEILTNSIRNQTSQQQHPKVLQAPEWMYEDYDDDDSIVVKEKPASNDRSKNETVKRNRPGCEDPFRAKLGVSSPARSFSTATTITTSTASTVRTSSKSPMDQYLRDKATGYYDSKMDTAMRGLSLSLPGSDFESDDSDTTGSKDPQMYRRQDDDDTDRRRPLRLRPVPSEGLGNLPFYASTEGYEC